MFVKQKEIYTGSYKIKRKLGEGGMGVVYLAEDIRLKRHVAIKTIKPSKTSFDQTLFVSLKEEALALARLNHPNIVQIYDVIDDNEFFFSFVMEYVGGRDLNYYLRENTVSVKQRLMWLHQIIEGLSAAHEKGIIHSDLKAENILISTDCKAKISDFGIYRNVKNITDFQRKRKNLGSYYTASPEQLLGRQICEKSDLFSFGVLAFILLGGCHPYGNTDNIIELTNKVINHDPISLKDKNDSLPDGLISLIRRLLRRSINDRPESAKDVSVALDKYINAYGNDEYDNKYSETLDLDENVKINLKEEKYKQVIGCSFNSSSAANSTLDYISDCLVKSKRRILSILISISIVMSVVALGTNIFLVSDPNKYISVLPVKFSRATDLTSGQRSLLSEVVNHSVTRKIIRSKELHLVGAQNIFDETLNLKDISLRTSSDVFIEPVVNCVRNRCDITLNRLEASEDADHWFVVKQQTWPMAFDQQYLNIADQIDTRVGKLFLNNKFSPKMESINEKEYIKFIAYRYNILNLRQDYKRLWDDLYSLKHIYSKYLPYYDLMSYLGDTLYDESGDEAFLEELTYLIDDGQKILGKSRSLISARLEIAFRNNQYKVGEELIKELEMYTNNEIQILSYKGLLENYRGNYESANNWYRKALRIKPSTLLWYRIANNYYHQGDRIKSLQALDELLKLDPFDKNATILHALVLLLDGQIHESIEIYKSLILSHPKSSIYSNLGVAYELLSEYSLAEEMFHHAVELNPNNSFWILNLADSLLLQGSVGEAKKLYQKVVAINIARESNWENLVVIAQAKVHLGDTSGALDALHRGLRLAPDNAEVLYTASLIYSVTEQWPVALSYIDYSLEKKISPVWYSFPWFDKLCRYHPKEFNRLLKRYNTSENKHRCMM